MEGPWEVHAAATDPDAKPWEVHASSGEPVKLSPAALNAKLKADFAASSTPEARAKAYQAFQKKEVDSMSTPAKLAAGAGKAVYDTARGIGQLIGKESKEDVAQSRVQDQALMGTKAGKVGNVLGYVGEAVPAAILAPGVGAAGAAGLGAKTAIGGAVGGAQGYAQPYASTREHVINTLAGAGVGAVIPSAGAAVGKVINGLATPAARELAADGVKLTPGMMLGGMAKTAEDKLTSVPIVGGAIRKAQNRALESYSNAAVDRVLAPLGQKLPTGVPAGRDALRYAQGAVSDTYNSTLSQMKATVDAGMRKDIGDIWNKYGTRLGDKGEELHQFITDGVLQKLSQSGPTTGRVVHDIQSDLGQQAARLMKSDLQSDRTLGQAVKDLQVSVKDMLKRNNTPELNRQLTSAGNAFKQLVRVQRAASAIGSTEGIITPNTLRTAVRATDSTRNKQAFSRGEAEMQDLAERGVGVIPSKVADSGTAGREGAANLLANVAMLPATLSAGAIAHAAYSKPAQYLMERAMMPRQNPVTNYLANLARQRVGNPVNALAAPALIPSTGPQQ